MKILRGAIYIANLNPSQGTEPGKMRPVVVVQTNLLNDVHPSTLICPLTTNVKKNTKYLRVHFTRIAGLNRDSDILVDQLRAIDNRRFLRKVGEVPVKQMEILDQNMKIVLDLDHGKIF